MPGPVIFAGFARFEPMLDQLVSELAGAEAAFADGRMFFSYQLPQLLTLGALLTLSGGCIPVGGAQSLAALDCAGAGL